MIAKNYMGLLCPLRKHLLYIFCIRALLILAGLSPGLLLWAQNDIQINSGSANLSKIISEIEKQTGYLFFYNDDIDVKKVIRIKTDKAPLSTILDEIESNKA